MQVVTFSARPIIGYQNLTVSTSPVGFTFATATESIQAADLSNVHYARMAYVSVEGNAVRVQFDPSVTVQAATDGHEFVAGEDFTIDGAANIRNFRAIRTGGADGTLRVTFWG